jgi:hypothetical protein
MSRVPSLKDLRDDLSLELRNSGTNPRYVDAELDMAIRRAVNALSEYFYYDDIDESKTITSGVGSLKYSYNFPVSNIYQVELIPTADAMPRNTTDWQEDSRFEGCDLYFLKHHQVGATIRVKYERHPIAYPDDLQLLASIDADDTTVVASTDVSDWPDIGYFKIDSEILAYTAIDRATDSFTVTRADSNTAAASHSSGATISFVNKIEKGVFYDGVKDWAIAYLNRMRIIDATSADVAGNVTIMRQILEDMDNWIRRHRMRSKRPTLSKVTGARPLNSRRRGVRGIRRTR